MSKNHAYETHGGILPDELARRRQESAGEKAKADVAYVAQSKFGSDSGSCQKIDYFVKGTIRSESFGKDNDMDENLYVFSFAEER